MDFLAGYGSGSDSDSDGGVPVSVPGSSTVQSSLTAVQLTASTTAAGASRLFASLPQPKNAAPAADGARNSTSGLPLDFFDSEQTAAGDAEEALSGLPAHFFDAAPATAAPAALKPPEQPVASAGTGISGSGPVQLFSKLPAASKRKVLLRPQIDLQLLAQQSDSDDDEPVAKKIKAAAPAAGKSSVLSFLPAPKHAAAGKRMDAGAGTKSSTFAEAQQHKQQQQEQEQQRAAQAAAVGPQATASNELYRMRPAAAAPPAVNAYHQRYCGQYEQQSEQQCVQEEYAAAGAYGAYDASVQQQPQRHQQQQYQQLAPEEVFLQEALQAEASKAARRAAGVGSSQLVMPDIQFKEIKADEVKYVDPAQKEAAQGMRSALGTDYAQQLRSQAAPHMGSKLARSKHQIGTLFANAKLRELEVMENRASGMKTKAETAGKYGW